MIAYKGFNSNLACTLGKGTFQYEVGKTYIEEKAQCVNSGFHCVEQPIEVLRWYRGGKSRYCIVNAGGDVHEDGNDRISCTELTILKEITLEQIGILECQWIMDHPERVCSVYVEKDCGHAKEGDIVVVRGKQPKASGEMGTTIFLLREGKGTKKIVDAGAYKIDGINYMPGKQYDVKGGICRDKKRTQKTESTAGHKCHDAAGKS